MMGLGRLWVAIWMLAGGTGLGQGTALRPSGGGGIPPILLTVKGRGVQIYVCKEAGKKAAWTFARPEATLYDGRGAEIGRHGAGPVWMLKDGSSVGGKVVGQQEAKDARSVPWLLLEAVDPKGNGVLGRVQWIRRSETLGGKARTSGCDAGRIGVEDRVEYSATYEFFGGA